jgi:hypothetical protein
MHSLFNSNLFSRNAGHAVPRTDLDAAQGRRGMRRVLLLCAACSLAACSDDDPARESSAASAETDSDGGTTSESGGSDAAVQDPGKGDGSDVIMIGDSWMSLGNTMTGIQGGLLKASGQPYRPYAIGGTTLLGGGTLAFLTPIPVQYDNAIKADPDVKTVIMTGGGNDILQSGLQADCQMKGEACGGQVLKILDRLTQLWTDMAEDGVKDVVYILYATPQGETVDFALPDGDGARKRCAQVPAPMRCHILETLDIVMGDIPDSIHPSQAASDRIGQAVVDLLASQSIRR